MQVDDSVVDAGTAGAVHGGDPHCNDERRPAQDEKKGCTDEHGSTVHTIDVHYGHSYMPEGQCCTFVTSNLVYQEIMSSCEDCVNFLCGQLYNASEETVIENQDQLNEAVVCGSDIWFQEDK